MKRAQAIGIYCNPIAGSGTKTKQALRALKLKLQAAGHAFAIIPSESKDAAAVWLAKNPSTTTFIVLGGDGTINFIVDHLPKLRNITVLPVPLGTANIIAHNAAITAASSLKIASATNNQGQTKPCLFGASFGFDAAVVAAMNTTRTGNITICSYIYPIIKMLFSFESHKQIVNIDGKDIDSFDFGIIAQTAIYGSHKFKLTGCNQPNTWQIFLIKHLTRYNMLQALCYGLFSNLKNAPCVSCYKAELITVKPLTSSTPLQIDGEAYGASPLTITVTHKTLTTLKNINKL
jgi:diacylglycerol kinase family enzyme